MLNIPNTRFDKSLYIEKRYKCNQIIIPLGCDCHPAYMLRSLHLRNYSLPFDWLNIHPVKTFEYITENINDGFENFLKNPKINERGYFISEHYPYSEFMHEKDLNNHETINKFKRRIDRFLNLVKNQQVHFIHNFPVYSLQNENEISHYINSIKLFQSKVSPNSTIHIYLRFDENLSENKLLSDKLYNDLQGLNINTTKYVRGLKDNGLWGVKSYYDNLLSDLNIKLKVTFPKIYLK